MVKARRKGRLVLIHWNAEECEELAGPLRAEGWQVQVVSDSDDLKRKDLRSHPPLALLISLRRLPSHGREVADALWSTKWGRAIPLVFLDGEAEKVAATRTRFPTALFTSYEELSAVLEELRQSSAE
jgi:hypothetical protein